MANIWIYLFIFCAGIIIGMIIHYQLVKNKISSTIIKGKVKQKKTIGSVQDVTNKIEKDSINKKDERQLRKEARRALRSSRNKN